MSVPTRITDLSATAASNSPAGSDTVGTTWDDYLRAAFQIIRGDLATKGADIASAATTDLGAVQGLSHDITGTTTITSFGTVAAGIWKIVKFEGVLTLTHNATSLILQTAANRTTADGDVGVYISEGSGNWREIAYHYSGALLMDTHALVMGSSDRTKKVRLEVDGLTTATTRVWTAADLDITLGKQPTRQVFTSGSGTYTTPSGATRINVRMVGGGGGGGGGGSAGSAGGSTTFSTLTASGGARNGGTAGTGTGGDINVSGGIGGPSSSANGSTGNVGGGTPFGSGIGGGGINNGNGQSASSNTGAGGGGGGGSGAGPGSSGGSGGGYVEKLITSPSATYSYAVGAKGTGDTAGANTGAGGDGGSGLIIVDEYYN